MITYCSSGQLIVQSKKKGRTYPVGRCSCLFTFGMMLHFLYIAKTLVYIFFNLKILNQLRNSNCHCRHAQSLIFNKYQKHDFKTYKIKKVTAFLSLSPLHFFIIFEFASIPYIRE